MDPDIAAQRGMLAADACYFCRTLRERHLPKYGHDGAAMHASLDRIARLEAGGARIFFGYDGDFWRAVPQAPQRSASGSRDWPKLSSVPRRFSMPMRLEGSCRCGAI